MENIKVKWSYKDSNRYYWYINLSLKGEQQDTFEWEYEIYRESDGGDPILLHTNTILGTYNIRPDLQDILLDFNTYLTGVIIDCVINATKE